MPVRRLQQKKCLEPPLVDPVLKKTAPGFCLQADSGRILREISPPSKTPFVLLGAYPNDKVTPKIL